MVAFLGGTIGNLTPSQRARFLFDLNCTMASDDSLLLGADLVKDTRRLVAAYDDAAGVTAAFGIDAGAASGSAAFAAGAAEALVAAVATGAAVIAEPVTDFARATGVLNSPFVEAITAARAVVVFAALGAGAPASGFFGGAGLNESRIFSAAAAS